MAKSRLKSTLLLKLLDRVATPVYLLTPNSQISYANQACLNWARVEAQELKGVICRYTSQILDDEIENRIRGLAPPPEFLNTEKLNFGIDACSVFVELSNGKKQYRDARTIRLLEGEKISLEGEPTPAALLVVCNHTSRSSETPSPSELIENSQRLHELLASLRELSKQKHTLQSVLGLDSTTLALRKKIDVAIESNADILISGPSGSGREHLARTIDHERRPHSTPPSPLHCELADPELIQRHVKELMQDRHSSARRVDAAPNCLLLLDVDKLSGVGQAELWGFLQLPNSSFQIISTSRQSLIELSRQGQFQPGLANYLSTLDLELLPLNERAGDLPILAQSFLEEANASRNRQLTGFSPAALQLIQQFNWPQNIDQLQRDVQSAANKARGNKIVLDDLPEDLRRASRALEMGRPSESPIQLDDYLKEIESELIQRAMQQAKGNKSRAAKLLGISRPKLLRRLQLLNAQSAESVDTDESDFVDSSAFEEADDHE